MSDRLSLSLPLFPLNTVLFPGGRLPLRIFEQRYMDMAKVCLKDGSPFGVCLIVEGKEVGEPAIPADIGTLARITTWDMAQLGVLQIVALGVQRFRIRDRGGGAGARARGAVGVRDGDRAAPTPERCAGWVKILGRFLDEQPALLKPPVQLSSA